MKTTEVNKELVGRRCECMCLGSMVTGVIEDITVSAITPRKWVCIFLLTRLGWRADLIHTLM